MPLFFVLFAWTLEEIRKNVVERFSSKWAEYASQIALIILILFSMANFNALLSDWKNIERWALRRRANFIAGNEQNLVYVINLEKITKPGASLAVVGAGTVPYFLPDRYAIDLLGKTDPVIAHGPIRYPMSIVDIPGMRPGHMKWNYAHSIGELKPDVIVLLWEGTRDEFQPYSPEYVPGGAGDKTWFFLRSGSPNILWDNVVFE
jgi:hypothetical protein